VAIVPPIMKGVFMATYKITIKLDNAAFEEGSEGAEVGRILHGLARRCEEMTIAYEKRLLDFNGNVVGEAVRKT